VDLLDRRNKRPALTAAVLSADDDFDIAELEKQVKLVRRKPSVARKALKDAEKFAFSREETWKRLSSVSDEPAASLKHGRRRIMLVNRHCSTTGCTTSRSSSSQCPG